MMLSWNSSTSLELEAGWKLCSTCMQGSVCHCACVEDKGQVSLLPYWSKVLFLPCSLHYTSWSTSFWSILLFPLRVGVLELPDTSHCVWCFMWLRSSSHLIHWTISWSSIFWILFYFWQVSPCTWGYLIWLARLAGQWVPGSSCLYSSNAGVTDTTTLS